MENNDLWPDFDGLPKQVSPRSILVEQGNFLAQKTKNVLTIKLNSGKSSTKPGKLYLNFKIVAPLVSNYSYLLLVVYHDALLYPCEVKFKGNITLCRTEESFRDQLKRIFNDKETVKVIASLLSQSSEVDTEKSE
jgi:hypothetical protein